MTATVSTSDAGLETSYRQRLRVRPPGYRSQREREMVDVMIELSGPNRRRPTVADALDVAAIAARQWFRVLFLPRRGEGRTAAAALAVILPMLLAYPIGRAASVLLFRASAAERGFGGPVLPHPSWPVWLCWALAIGCVLLGRAGLARFPTENFFARHTPRPPSWRACHTRFPSAGFLVTQAAYASNRPSPLAA